MSSEARADIQRACEELIVRYTHIADFGPGETMADIFTDDAVWTSGQDTYTGRDELIAFFGRDRGHTKSRHVSSNALVTVTGDHEAEGLSYFTLYRYHEEKPRVPDLDSQPVILGEYRDQYRRTEDGWRIARREADVGFVRRSMM
ncbi:MAG: nuclear transport factor 2 family protein [Actinomycetota bacterium]|jgi:hypothetical protein|nr:nuclear transport factor 2 family protein [Actinomycetota bacterium]